MPSPDPLRLAALIVELRRTLRRRAEPPPEGRTVSASARRTPAEEEVMRYLATHPGEGTSALARALRLRANTVSGVCSALVRDGLLRREADPADGRAVRFYLSEEVAAQRERKMTHRSSRLSSALERLEAGQREQIAAAMPALEDLVDLLDQASAPPPRVAGNTTD